MTTLMDPGTEANAMERTMDDARVLVAREGSELARTLRAGGWVARAGWRSMAGDEAVWFVRFEFPGADNDVARVG